MSDLFLRSPNEMSTRRPAHRSKHNASQAGLEQTPTNRQRRGVEQATLRQCRQTPEIDLS